MGIVGKNAASADERTTEESNDVEGTVDGGSIGVVEWERQVGDGAPGVGGGVVGVDLLAWAAVDWGEGLPVQERGVFDGRGKLAMAPGPLRRAERGLGAATRIAGASSGRSRGGEEGALAVEA